MASAASTAGSGTAMDSSAADRQEPLVVLRLGDFLQVFRLPDRPPQGEAKSPRQGF